VKRTGPTNLFLRMEIRRIKKAAKGSAFWKAVFKEVNKSRRLVHEVNLSKIARYAKPDSIVVVPGRVLGAGTINSPITIAALSFSKSAQKKIVQAGGRALPLSEVVRVNPSGSGLVILK
jgi:large subunit ribosomal protein L18e